jgi:hypothetical protein
MLRPPAGRGGPVPGGDGRLAIAATPAVSAPGVSRTGRAGVVVGLVAVVIRAVVTWWRELLDQPCPPEPAVGWFLWEYRPTPTESPTDLPAETGDGDGLVDGADRCRLIVRRDGSWRA